MTVPRLLFVHAHPDDESSKGAATAARYVDDGAEVVLVTATRGEAGDVLNDNYGGEVDPADMPQVRAEELQRAVQIIGFTRCHQLGEVDSGYHEDPADLPDGCFANAPLDRPADRLADLIRAERPHVLVTYPADGGYPHPDHIRVHEVTMVAVERAASSAGADGTAAWDVPRTVFATGFPIERTLLIHEAMTQGGMDSPYADWVDKLDERGPRDADADPDCRVHVAQWFTRRDDALRAHATQVDPDGPWFSVPRDLEAEIFPWETYVLLRGQEYPDGATDLFEGLDLTE